MRFRHRKGKHRARPIMVGLRWKPRTMTRRVLLYPSCRYELEHKEDQHDYNKLFGLGFLSIHWAPHHIDSVRFGWYHDLITDKPVFAAYVYVNRERIIQDIWAGNFGWAYDLKIEIAPEAYILTISDTGTNRIEGRAVIPKSHSKRLAFVLGPFFGGNQPSNKNMEMEIIKIK